MKGKFFFKRVAQFCASARLLTSACATPGVNLNTDFNGRVLLWICDLASATAATVAAIAAVSCCLSAVFLSLVVCLFVLD